MPTTEEKIQQLINYLGEPKFTSGTLQDFQNCLNDAVDVIKDVHNKCGDLQTQINDLDERVSNLEV